MNSKISTLNFYLDEHGIIRAGGRLEKSNINNDYNQLYFLNVQLLKRCKKNYALFLKYSRFARNVATECHIWFSTR